MHVQGATYADAADATAGVGLTFDHPAQEGAAKPRPIGGVLWAEVNGEAAERLARGVARLRPQDRKSSTVVPKAERQLWMVDVIATAACPGPRSGGGAEYMVREFRAKIYLNREVRYLRMGTVGKTVARWRPSSKMACGRSKLKVLMRADQKRWRDRAMSKGIAPGAYGRP